LLSHSNNGAVDPDRAQRLRGAVELIRQRAPDLEIDGHMRADAALNEQVRDAVRPGSTLQGNANLLIMPNVDAAKIAYDIMKTLGDAVSIGPVLLGLAQPVHILTSSATVRRIVNASALAVVDAQVRDNSGRPIVEKDRTNIESAQEAV
jgi:malate dehydrogenase (oxaloacetate-decarboxylating)(NADP+)